MKLSYSHDLFPPGLILPVRICPLGAKDGAAAEGKVDTGADRTVIPEPLRRQLRLPPRGVIRARGAFDAAFELRPTYYVTVILNDSLSFDLEAIASPARYCLLGRDALNQIILYANGPSEVFELTTGP
jgi:hypothetical protein